MKERILLLCLILLISCSNDKESDNANNFIGEIEQISNFGGSGEDTPRSVIETEDGGIAVFGYTNSIDGDITDKNIAVNDYWLLKFNSNGDLEWNKTYGGSGDDKGQSVVQTTDGGYAITGYAMSADGDGSNNEGFHDNWILKLDAEGNIQWEKSFGYSGHDHSYDLLQTSDDGFLFVGFLDVTASEGAGNSGKNATTSRHGVGEFWINKIDANGNLEWQRYFGGTNNDRAYSAVQADDGGFVITGFSESNDFDITNPNGGYDFWVIKISASGDLLWQKNFGGSDIDVANDICKTKDGNYVVVGQSFSADVNVSLNNGQSDILLLKIDDFGTLLWSKTFGGTQFDSAESISQTSDGGFVISGNSKSTDNDLSANGGENDIWVLKTDSTGDLIWQKSIGGMGLDFAFDAIETSKGKLMVVGESPSTDFPDIQNRGLIDLVLIQIK